MPEIAARAHAERLDHAVEAALSEAGVALAEIDAIPRVGGIAIVAGGDTRAASVAAGLAALAGGVLDDLVPEPDEASHAALERLRTVPWPEVRHEHPDQ